MFHLFIEGKLVRVPRQVHYPPETSDADESLQLLVEFGLVDTFLEHLYSVGVVLAWFQTV